MGFVWRIAVALFANIVALYAAGRFINDFTVPSDIKHLVVAGVALTLINLLVRPILKLILSPIIILTLGLGVIAVNALTLTLLATLLQTVTINGILPLLYATILISFINIAIRKIL